MLAWHVLYHLTILYFFLKKEKKLPIFQDNEYFYFFQLALFANFIYFYFCYPIANCLHWQINTYLLRQGSIQKDRIKL